MPRRLLVLLGCAGLAACASPPAPPVPPDYQGPTVQLMDSGTKEARNKASFFAAVAIDGATIDNAIRETRIATHGRGDTLHDRYTIRNVPVRPMKIKLVGTHQTAMPIHELASRAAGTFFSVDGEVAWTPTAGVRYLVTGELGKARSCVWIAEALSMTVVTERVCR